MGHDDGLASQSYTVHSKYDGRFGQDVLAEMCHNFHALVVCGNSTIYALFYTVAIVAKYTTIALWPHKLSCCSYIKGYSILKNLFT